MKMKNMWNSQSKFEKRLEDLLIDFNTYCEDIIIKTVWYGNQLTQVDRSGGNILGKKETFSSNQSFALCIKK